MATPFDAKGVALLNRLLFLFLADSSHAIFQIVQDALSVLHCRFGGDRSAAMHKLGVLE